MPSIPTEQPFVVTGGGAKTFQLNGDYTYTQINVDGRDAGIVTVTARGIKADNNPANFKTSDFEQVTDGAINLATTPPKRTFTIANKRLSAIRLEDSAPGQSYTVFILQWNRANS